MSIAFLSNTEKESFSNKFSCIGKLSLASAVISLLPVPFLQRAPPEHNNVTSIFSFPEEPRFRGAFSLEMADFHKLNRKGAGKPVELWHSNRRLCGSEYYSSTHINWAIVCVYCGWQAVKTLLSVLSVWLVMIVLCVYLHLCNIYPLWILAGLAKRNSSSHSYHPSVAYCVVPWVSTFYRVPSLSQNKSSIWIRNVNIAISV